MTAARSRSSLASVIVIAAFNLLLDFDHRPGHQHGAEEEFAWYIAFGLMVTLIWLYLEFLYLLSYLRE